jgi:hypothetical protein
VLSGALIGAALGAIVSGAGFLWEAKSQPRPSMTRTPAVEVTPRAPSIEDGKRGENGAPRASLREPPDDMRTLPASRTATAPALGDRGSPPPATTAPEAADPSAGASPGIVLAERSAGAEQTPPANDLSSEVDLLDRARKALDTSPAQALALTQEHMARYPGGALSPEREVVAIRALVKLGRTAEARALADRFYAAFPRSVYRTRIAEYIGR